MSTDEAVLETEAARNEQIPDDQVAAVTPPSLTVGLATFIKKRAKTNSVQRGLRKPVQPSLALKESDDESEEESVDEVRAQISQMGRKRKRGGLVQSASIRKAPYEKEDLGVRYSASRVSKSVLDPRNQATSISAEFAADSQTLKQSESISTSKENSDDLYHGQKGYRNLVPKREQISTKYNSMGPQRAASNLRMTTYTDYAPGMSPSSLIKLC
jgi:hypothetical protein